ncbi:condensin complex subunit 1 [Mobula hypostoma]|uniref:condensin complex subunit 1 n=1 Tax=Mobula hypostoma TaxID=723540 RepID=UPI002FC3C060
MDFEFVIPQARLDLLKSGRVKQYVVEELLPTSQLPQRVKEFESALRSQGPSAILEHFDAPYSVVCRFASVNSTLQEQTFDLLMKVVSGHAGELPGVLADSELDPSDRLRHLNVLKMGCYLLSQLMEALEERGLQLQAANLGPTGKARRARPGPPSQGRLWDWESERLCALQHLTHLLQLDLGRLWPLGLPEADFCRVISGACYRLLESPTAAHVRSRPLCEAVAHLLGLMIRRHNHTLGATLNVIQLLQHFEHSPSVLVQVVSLWTREYGAKTIVAEIMREIGLCASGDSSRETLGVRSFGTFLAELSEAIPEVMIPNVSLIMDLLNRESHVLRTAVLSCAAQMVTQALSGPGLEPASRQLRDSFLDTLQLHLNDTHALVRSRGLQLLALVVQAKALPMKRFHPVVTLAMGRLCDKAVNVCKNAIHLLGTVLANNPFTGKLSIEELRTSLEKEMGKLAQLREERTQAGAMVLEPGEEWAAMQPELLPAVRCVLQEEEETHRGEEDPEDRAGDDDTAQRLSDRICSLLKAAKYKQAVRLAREGRELFADEPPFLAPDPDGAGSEEDALLRVLETCLTGPGTDRVSESYCPPPDAEQETGGASSLARQEVLVQYLRDTLTFGEKIQGAIDVVCKLLGSKNPSVVQDAIHFFVTISEFEVSGSMVGMRQMLPLVWSKEAGVKEAVVEAYRRLYLNPGGKRPKPQTLVQNLTGLIFDSTVERIKCLEELVSEFVQKEEVDSAVIQLLWERFTAKVPCTPEERRAAVILLGMAARGEPEIVGSNLETLYTVGLGSQASQDYQLARDICLAVGKLSNSKKGVPGRSEAAFRLPSDHPLFSHLCAAVTEGFSVPSLHWRPFAEAAVSLLYRLAENPDRLCGSLLLGCSRLLVAPGPPGDSPPPGAQSEEGKGGVTELPVHMLTNLVSLVGQVALQQVVHLEQAVGPELQRRRLDREQKANKQRGANKPKRASVSAIEEELGLAENAAEDTEAELVRKVCDAELLQEGQLLSAFIPLVVKLCSNPGVYSDPDLATASCLALCKLAIVSHDFCESHLRLLFTLLEKSALPAIRSNTMVALGDLSFRFPNLIEPWTPHLYARLRDPSPAVRRTALIVMTHLILKDMVKVKGQISEMASLLVDEEEEIALLARSFFNELSNKGNAVYNLLPDIISRLSDPEGGIEEEPFRTVMRQMFSYISKDRQVESLVEKLCQRFRTARLERQHRDLAFCLGLLPGTDRVLRRLQENLDCLADKLQHDAVYQQLMALVGKMRRGLRPEFKVLVDEFEQKITHCHSRGMDDGELEEAPQPPKAVSKKPAEKKAGPSRTPAALQVTPRVSSRSRPARRVRVDFSSDEEQEEGGVMACETPEFMSPIRRSSRRRGAAASK